MSRHHTDPGSLMTVYRAALTAGAQASRLDAMSDECQAVTQAAISSFRSLQGRADALGLFSQNESYDEISTISMIYLVAPYAFAEVLVRQKTTRRFERLKVIADAEEQLKKFIKRVELLRLLPVPDDERKLFAKKSRFNILEAGRKREMKIKQYQTEKKLKERIEVLRAQRDPKLSGQPLDTDFDLIQGCLPAEHKVEPNEEELEHEDIIRETISHMLRLCWARANQLMGDLTAEKELLARAPPEEDEAGEKAKWDERMKIAKKEREKEKAKMKGKGKGRSGGDEDDEDMTWRLDSKTRYVSGTDADGNLLDKQGRPLRPFTLISSTASRKKLQQGVFAPDHRMPTMTIDEYLEREADMGNILYGTGDEGPTSEEQMQLDAEEDGTMDAERAAERWRNKGEYWSVYTELNPRGMGNTMNRG